ncbi:MAG: alpha/beta hydrolase [Pseudomonadales bacterium]
MRKSAQTAIKLIEWGAGHPVVLIHGSASDHRTWEHQIEAFGACFHVVTYSRRYHWPNQKISDGAEYSMAEQVDDLLELLLSQDTANAHLVGHSYGAYLALMATIREPGLVEKLVLAEPPVIPLFTSFPPEPQEILGLLVTRPRTAVPIIRFAATGLGPATSAARKDDMDEAMSYFGNAVLGSKAFAALSPTRLEQVRVNFSKAELLSDTFMLPLNQRDVANIEAQTLLVTGEKSPTFLHRLTDRLEELMPNTERMKIPEASHIMHEDSPEAYNQAVLSFLQK